jgi:hypothetical protein
LQATVDRLDGVTFVRVMPDGAGFLAGIRPGDRLLTFDGTPIESPNRFASVLGTYPAGWHVPLEIERDGNRRELIAKLDPIAPRLPAPFMTDEAVNARQVERVLSAYQDVVLPGGSARRPKGWTCTLTRAHEAGPGRRGPRVEHYDVSWATGQPIRMERRDRDESAGRAIEYDDNSAMQRIGAGGKAAELTPGRRLIHSAMYVMQCRLLEAIDASGLVGATHAGGDALVREGDIAEGPSGGERPMLELIEWPLGEDGLATFAFGVDSHRLLRVDIRDVVSGDGTNVDVLDYCEAGGIMWPCMIEVRGEGYAYRDTYSDWNLSP